jgi:hypothetical protein
VTIGDFAVTCHLAMRGFTTRQWHWWFELSVVLRLSNCRCDIGFNPQARIALLRKTRAIVARRERSGRRTGLDLQVLWSASKLSQDKAHSENEVKGG